MIDSNDALVDEFAKRGMQENANMYVGVMIFDTYYNSLSAHINHNNTITTPLRQNKKKTLPERESLIIIYIGITSRRVTRHAVGRESSQPVRDSRPKPFPVPTLPTPSTIHRG